MEGLASGRPVVINRAVLPEFARIIEESRSGVVYDETIGLSKALEELRDDYLARGSSMQEQSRACALERFDSQKALQALQKEVQ